MRALVFLEHHAGALSRASLGVLAHARALAARDERADAALAAVVAGFRVGALAPEAARHGAGLLYLADDERLAAPLPGPRVDVLARLVERERFDTVLFAQSVLASDLAAALAARLQAGLNWDLVRLALAGGELVGSRPALADSVWAEVGWSSPLRLAVFRAGAFDPVELAEPAAIELRELEVELAARSLRVRLVEAAPDESGGPSIEDADVVVAGGRGLGGPEGFALAEELASALGGAVGATRAVVDAGWYPYAAQVGQTGKSVSPGLYVALGVSGAVQHRVGMQRSGVIVAINTDASAPIFELADLGVVGDVKAIVPRLAALVRAARGAQA